MSMPLRNVAAPYVPADADIDPNWRSVLDKLTDVLALALADQEPAPGTLLAGLYAVDDLLAPVNAARYAVMIHVANRLLDLPAQRPARIFALSRTADVLFDDGLSGKAVRVHRAIVDEFGGITDDLEICDQVVRSQLFIAVELGVKGRHTQALAIYDAIIGRWGAEPYDPIRISVANAKLYHSTCLYDVSEEEEDAEPTIARWEAIIAEYEHDTVPGICDLVALTYDKLSELVANHHGDDAAIQMVDRMVAWAERPGITAPPDAISEALLTKYATLAQRGDRGGAAATAKTILDRQPLDEDAVDRLVRWTISDAETGLAAQTKNAGASLIDLIDVARMVRVQDEPLGQRLAMRWAKLLQDHDDWEAALPIYQRAALEWRDDDSPGSRALRFDAHLAAGLVFDHLGRHQDELSQYDAVIEAWRDGDSDEATDYMSRCLRNKRITLTDLDDVTGADAAAELLTQRCRSCTHAGVRARVLENQRHRIDRALARDEVSEMLRLRCELLDIFSTDTDPETLSEVVPVASLAARALILRNDKPRAIAVYRSVWGMSPHVSDPETQAKICQSLVEFGLFQQIEGQFEDAVSTLRKVLAVFHDLGLARADIAQVLTLAEEHLRQSERRQPYHLPSHSPPSPSGLSRWGAILAGMARRLMSGGRG